MGQLHKLVSLQQEEIVYLREQLRLLAHKMFGPKTDRISGLEQQVSMFEEPVASKAESEDEPRDEAQGHRRRN